MRRDHLIRVAPQDICGAAPLPRRSLAQRDPGCTELCISISLWPVWQLSTPKVPLVHGQSRMSPANGTVSASEQYGSFRVEVVGETRRHRISGNAGRSRFGHSLMTISVLTQGWDFSFQMCAGGACVCAPCPGVPFRAEGGK